MSNFVIIFCDNQELLNNNPDLLQVTRVPATTAKTSGGGNVVSSGVVLAAAPTPTPALIDIGDNTNNTDLGQQQTKSKKTKTHEKALLLSDDEFQ